MRKFLFITLLATGLMACSNAPPPEESAKTIDVQTIEVADYQNMVFEALLTGVNQLVAGNSFATNIAKEAIYSHPITLSQMWEVSGKSGDLVIIAESLKRNTLYGSLSAGYQQESESETRPHPSDDSVSATEIFAESTTFGVVPKNREIEFCLKHPLHLIADKENVNKSNSEFVQNKQNTNHGYPLSAN